MRRRPISLVFSWDVFWMVYCKNSLCSFCPEFRTGKTQLSHTLCGEKGAFFFSFTQLIFVIRSYTWHKSDSVSTLFQSPPSCQARTATQVEKLSSSTQRTPCILTGSPHLTLRLMLSLIVSCVHERSCRCYDHFSSSVVCSS